MKRTCLGFALIAILISVKGYGQSQTFKLNLNNKSTLTSYCDITGHPVTDSVLPGQSKTIVFKLDKSFLSFYLNLRTAIPTPNTYQYKTIRILNTEKKKDILINANNQLEYELTPSEAIVAKFNPQLLNRNFYKLDSVISINANDIAAAEIIHLSIADIDVPVDTIRKYNEMLSAKVRESAYGKRLTSYLEARTRLNLGNYIPAFRLRDSSGKMVKLKKLKADYILLDFWFSRCGPCIKAFPDLQKLYTRSDRKKLEIMGISIDQASEKDLWRSMIRKYDLNWVNVLDAKTQVVKTLAIVNYPTRILIDRKRRILLVDTNNSKADFYKQVEKIINTAN